MLAQLPPAVWFGLAALMVPILPQAIRGVAILAVPVVSLVHMFWLIGGWPGDGWTGSSAAEVVFLGETLTFFRLDSLSLPFAILFHLAAFVGLVYSIHVKDTVQQVSALLYAGSAVGSACAGDLLSLLIMWEVLTVSSVFLIWARRTTRARNVALRYFLFQLLSGVLLLNGIAWMASSGKSLEFGAIPLDSIPAWCLLIGFGLKAGFPLLHSWIIDGYPQGTVTGTLFLSGLTSKVAIYALARGFAGTDLLVTIGTVMAVWPIFFAVIENDLRRVLSYSMINQLGFMVVGIGIGTDLAINGAVAHAFNDVFFKGLLFMAMGAVLFRTGTANGTDLGGLYKTMPKTTGLCLIGAASISAVPLFSGFVSKGMIMTAVMEEHHTVIWCLLLFAAAGVVEHAGLRVQAVTGERRLAAPQAVVHAAPQVCQVPLHVAG